MIIFNVATELFGSDGVKGSLVGGAVFNVDIWHGGNGNENVGLYFLG